MIVVVFEQELTYLVVISSFKDWITIESQEAFSLECLKFVHSK